jgi:crossover junction endodeoxyribonuclease RuvC
MLFIGIDPGNMGAIAFLRVAPEGNKTVQIFDAPTMKVKGPKKTKTELVDTEMAAIVKANALPEESKYAIIEKVGTMPEQGIVSAFAFGCGWGMWRGILAALGIPYTLVHPVTWKKAMMADMGKSKDASRLIAARLFPEYHSLFQRVKDDGRAEALLLAEHGRRTYGLAGIGGSDDLTRQPVSGMLPLTLAGGEHPPVPR